MCLHDNKEQKIDHVFKEIYEFIESATIPEKLSPTKKKGLAFSKE